MKRNKYLFWLVGLSMLTGCTLTDTNSFPAERNSNQLADSFLEEKPITTNLKIIDRLLPKKNSRMRTAPFTHVMLHFTNDASRNPHDPYNIENVYALFEEYEVSAHYMIGREGEIYRLVPEERAAFHAGKGIHLNYQEYRNNMNDISIGIELLAIGTKEEMLSIIPEDVYDSIDPALIGYTDAQYATLHLLLDEIIDRHPAIIRDREHVIGHHEYAPVRKTDPGELFDWSRIGF